MKCSISYLRKNFSIIINLLSSGKEKTVIVTKRGKPFLLFTPFLNNSKNRIGIAKNEMEDFEISLQDFNSIKIEDFGV